MNQERKQNSARVGIMQVAPVLMDKNACVEKALKYIGEAASQGCELIVFPEAYLPCYPKAITFGSVIGWRTPAGRRDWRRYYDNAIAVGDGAFQSLAEAAGKHKVYLSMGCIEKEPGHGTLYCSVFFFGPDGKYLGRHRKLKPTAGERVVWGEGDASELTVVDAPFGRFGAVICWENYMPLLRTAMYGKGIEIYLAPTADYRESWLCTARHIAREGGCFVLSANLCYKKSDYSPEIETVLPDDEIPPGIINEAGSVTNGGSAIISPFGEYLVGPVYDSEQMLIADLDMNMIAEARIDFDPVGHYARPDIFKLCVNETPLRHVEYYTDKNDVTDIKGGKTQ
jgi:nitrilase